MMHHISLQQAQINTRAAVNAAKDAKSERNRGKSHSDSDARAVMDEAMYLDMDTKTATKEVGKHLEKYMKSRRGKERKRMPKEKTFSQAQLDRMLR